MAVNVNDRASIERFYPRDDFVRDAAENARDKASIQKGLRITAPPDASGRFEVTRASVHVGERDPEGDSIFLPATRAVGPGLVDEEAAPDPQDNARSADEAYRDFIDRVVAAARSATFKPAIGKGEDRLKGFHGG